MRESSKRDKDERLQAAENQEHLRNEKNLSFVETFKNKILKVKVEETNRNQSKLVHVHGREKKSKINMAVSQIYLPKCFLRQDAICLCEKLSPMNLRFCLRCYVENSHFGHICGSTCVSKLEG